MSVDFPQPLGPKIETIFPFGISKLKSLYKTDPLKDLSNPRIVTWVPICAGKSRTLLMLFHPNEQYVFLLSKIKG